MLIKIGRSAIIVASVIFLVLVTAFYFWYELNDYPVIKNHICSGSFKNKTILLIGDSLAVGLSDYLGNLTRWKDGNFFSDAVGGTTTDYWLGEKIKESFKRAEQETGRYPEIVFISLGTNDVFSNPDSELDFLGGKIKNLLSEISTDTAVIWIGPPRWPPSRDKKLDTSIAKQIILNNLDERTEYFDSRNLDLKNTDRDDGDGHPSSPAYKFWAKKIWHWCGGLQ